MACSISDTAPVVGSRNTSSSAARPPIAKTSCAIISDLVARPLSSSGTAMACPPVRPRAKMVTLYTRSISGMAQAASVWPAS
ncbi:Uncharacterised protein [Mycobacteroides abscessus subsp. abscessus]|nr:Uncharacterised protein [Mycobacteroides abscessus subsp. abscessus]